MLHFGRFLSTAFARIGKSVLGRFKVSLRFSGDFISSLSHAREKRCRNKPSSQGWMPYPPYSNLLPFRSATSTLSQIFIDVRIIGQFDFSVANNPIGLPSSVLSLYFGRFYLLLKGGDWLVTIVQTWPLNWCTYCGCRIDHCIHRHFHSRTFYLDICNKK